MKYFTLVLLLILSLLITFPASASVCRNYNGYQICILSIERSAKNYWEYRASVSVDGAKTPIEVYNCRDRLCRCPLGNRVKVQNDGTILPFEQKDPGGLICSFFNSSGLQTRAR